jgi:hypothetical protein
MHYTVYENSTNKRNVTYEEKRVAREILSMIEQVCFSDEYRDYRVGYGSKGQRDLIIHMIKDTYDIG